jgi:zinc-binding alcohol dehydrogenase/oxidoreductase
MGTMGDFREVMKHIFSRRLKAVVDRTFPLSEARAAHEYLQEGKQFGKVVLTVD